MQFTGQIHFEFYEWKECFEVWRQNVSLYDDGIVLILSTNPQSSGYWIENAKPKIELGNGDYAYTGSAVYDLEKRIIAEHKNAEKENRSPQMIL